MDENTNNLTRRIEALEKWKAERERQQISFPLDFQSQVILRNYFMAITGVVKTIGGASGNEFTTYIGQQGPYPFQVGADTFIPYTVNVSANTLTVQKVAFQDDMQVYVTTSGTPPSPLDTVTNYFVVNSTGLTFKLSLTQGGAPIDITDDGDGSQYIYFF